MQDNNSSDGKRCPSCGQWKPFTDFYRNKSTRDGYQSACKPCFLAQNEASRQRHIEERNAKSREYAKRYAAMHQQQVAEKQRAWYAEKGREWHKQHRQANPERYREATRRWQRKDGNSSNAIRRRRAAKIGNGGSHTEAQWQAMVARYDGRCLCCGNIPSGVWPDVLTRDHVIPLKHGGTDDIENIQPLCNLCNVTKGERHSTDYRKLA